MTEMKHILEEHRRYLLSFKTWGVSHGQKLVLKNNCFDLNTRFNLQKDIE